MKMDVECPRCGRSHVFDVDDRVPRQVFDHRCSGGQRVETRVLKHTEKMTIRSWTWDHVPTGQYRTPEGTA